MKTSEVKCVFLFTLGIQVGDEVVIDGGMATFEVVEKIGKDLKCKCTDPGLLLPRAKLCFWREGKLVGNNFELPTLSMKVVLVLTEYIQYMNSFEKMVFAFF